MSQASMQLVLAARDGDIATVRRVLADGCMNVNATDEYGRSPLYRASYDGHLHVVKTLIAAGANVNKANKDGRSPLLTTSVNGHLDVLQTLIEAGANVNQGDKINGTPLFVASVKGHHRVVWSLLGAGADVNVATSDINASPLFAASENGHHDVVLILLGAGADVNVATSDVGWSALLTASFNGYLDIVKSLIEAESNINLADKDGRSPLYSASFNGHLEVVKTLIEAGANVDQVSKKGWSPLMTSTFKGHLNIVKTLIEAGTNVHQANKDGKTALKIAVEKGHDEIIDVLKNSQSKVIAPKTKVVQSAEELIATRAGQQLLDTRLQNEALQWQLSLQAQQADERVRSAEERATGVEKKCLETQQKSEAFKQQVKQLVHRADERAQSAEERAKRAEERVIRIEQELKMSLQQPEAQPRCQDLRIPQNGSNDMKLSWKIEPDEIEVIEERSIGKGAWGEVRVAMFRGIKVAAKFIHEEIISPCTKDLFIREMNIAACVRHPNLLLFIGAALDTNKHVILTELMPANLRSIIESISRDRDHVISIGADVARGLNYLHLMRPDPIIHRDVSSANVLVEPTKSDGYRAKVSDFGSANFLSKVTTVAPGNATYAAPELSDPKLQSPKMDVYSYGILLLEMATGQFPDCSLQAIQLDTLPWQEMVVMIRRCICRMAGDRPTMKDVLLELPKVTKYRTVSIIA